MPHTRQVERRELRALLEDHRSILMAAPRRVGKTWLIKKLKTDLETAGWLCPLLDVQGCRTEDDFWRRLCKALQSTRGFKRHVDHLLQRLAQISHGSADATVLQTLVRLDHRAFAETLIRALDQCGKPTVVLIDEISLFVLTLAQSEAGEPKRQTRDLLYELRRLQSTYPNVRWLMTGSIGLDEVAGRFGLQGALVDLNLYPLASFDEAAARSFLASPNVIPPVQFTPEGFARFIAEIGWLSPYYLKILGERVHPSGDDKDRPVATAEDVDRAVTDILGPSYRPYFSVWGEHIDKNFAAGDSAILRALLDRLSRDPSGETATTLLTHLATPFPALTPARLRDLLRTLETDAFLIHRDERHAFRSPLLRRYWADHEAD